ncbi:MAG: class I SAM-dependent methyltransferase [Methanomicrobiales archaeon]|nr:class I SAM-dependent methyltransferase [Methanomicrobiales archaeon]
MRYTDIDWNSVWKDLYEKNTESRGCASVWASREKAHAFLTQSRENPERIRHVIESLPLKAESTVLDIGAGPGTLAVPIARRATRVTAVEPAAGMAEVMEEYATEEGVSNLSIVQKRWEEIDPAVDLNGSHDIVLASYSLGMPDIRTAIEMMCEASSGWVYLFWFAGTTAWEQAMVDLWPRLHGEEFRSGPKVDILWNVLYSMGIYPNVETVRMEHTRRFPSIDAAVNEFREQYRITSPAQEEVLREYLAASLLRKENGGYLHSGATTRIRLWWEV